MRRQKKLSALHIFVFLVACSGGGSSTETGATVITTAPPSFESPHPDIWEIATASEAGFDVGLLDSAFEHAMTDGFYSQAVLLIKDGKLVKEQYRGITNAEAGTLASTAALLEAQHGLLDPGGLAGDRARPAQQQP